MASTEGLVLFLSNVYWELVISPNFIWAKKLEKESGHDFT